MPLNAVFLINQYTLFRTYVRQLCWDIEAVFAHLVFRIYFL